MTELERTLAGLAAELDYPPTPALAPAVRSRVERAPRPRRPLMRRRSLAIAFALLLLLAGSAVAAVPSWRHSVLDWLGLRSVKIERAPRLPALPPGAGSQLALGTRVTLPQAEAHVSFPVLAPAGRSPDAVYLDTVPTGGQVALAYRPRPGLPESGSTGLGMLITEFRGDQPFTFLQKTLGPGTTAERVTVNGGRGVWIAGSPHIVLYTDPQGRIRDYTPRLATNTLLWRQGSVLLRLEAHIPKAAALRIAGTLRP
ncbi:MAG: hypothetical protein ACXVRH_02640 [Thermoleophilaceae bacterium]